MKIVWDEPKRLANILKHGYDFATLDEAFFRKALYEPARGHRLFAYAPMGTRVICVVFLPLGSEAVSIISMRPSRRVELEAFNDKIS